MSQHEIDKIVPHTNNDVEIYPFRSDEYLVQHKSLGYQLHINQRCYDLLCLVDGNRNIQSITRIYNEKSNVGIKPEVVYSLLYQKLGKFGIINHNHHKVEKRSRSKYLALSFIFISPKLLSFITPFLTFLFKREVFYPVFLSSVVLICVVFYLNIEVIPLWLSIADVPMLNIVLYIIIFQLGSLFHEIGHAVACRSFGAHPGGIGFGFYLFTPVLFTDVSDAWKLSKGEKVVVNLAGVYFECILASVTLLYYLFTPDITYLILPCILIIHTLYNLNPFIKLDGYWILSDLTETPNLQKKSYNKVKDIFHRFKRLNFKFEDRRELLLFLYGLISSSMVFVFLIVLVIYDPYYILSFPKDVIKHLIVFDFKYIVTQTRSIIIPVIFWYLVIRLAISSYARIIKSLKSILSMRNTPTT